MTVRDATTILEVKPGLVYRLCQQGKLAHYRLEGGVAGRGIIRLDPDDVAAYKRSCRFETVAIANPGGQEQPPAHLVFPTVPVPGGYFERKKARLAGRA